MKRFAASHPSQVSAALRRMASSIDSARRPSKELVARDLRTVLAALEGRTAASEGPGETDIQPPNEHWWHEGDDKDGPVFTIHYGSDGAPSSDHRSGDPETNGYEVKFFIGKLFGGGTKYYFSVGGKFLGKEFSGSITLHVQNGEYSGWDWNDAGYSDTDPDNWIDPETDPEGALQVILDTASAEAGLA